LAYLPAAAAAIGRTIHLIAGDGACLFRALSFLLFGTEGYHFTLRILAHKILKENQKLYEPFFELVSDETPDMYLERLRAADAWGANVELLSLCRYFNVAASVYELDYATKAFRLPNTIGDSAGGAPVVIELCL
jgi:hypothetical protein